MYALMGMALAYFAYRLNLPLAIRSALYPIFGKRVDGPLGTLVDIAAVLGTVFGVATSLGIGVVFLNVGLNVLFGVPIGTRRPDRRWRPRRHHRRRLGDDRRRQGHPVLSQLNVLLALSRWPAVLSPARRRS